MVTDLSKIFLLKSGAASAKENVLLWIAVLGNFFINLFVGVFLLFNEKKLGLLYERRIT